MKHDIPPAHDVGALPTPVCVVGDVHLTPAQPDVQRAFLAFLERWNGAGGTLVLLGDIFDYWVSRSQQHDADVKPMLDALRAKARAGVRITFIPGNRDFLFTGADDLDVEVWPDLVRTSWGDRTVLLTHGDLLCTADHEYLSMRKKLRSRWFLGVFPRLPDWFVHRAARWLRGKSKKAKQRKSPSAMGLDYGAAGAWMQAHGADLLVAGHVHTGVNHRLPGTPIRDVMVLKDWERGGSVVHFDGQRVVHEPPVT